MADSSDLQDLKEIFRKAKSGRQRLEPEWFLCVAYYSGQQWLWWNRGNLDEPQLEDWRVKLVDNRILPAVSSRVARKLKNRPIMEVTPETTGDTDLDDAQLGNLVLEDRWKGLNLSIKLLQAQMWQEITGAGFWKIYWNPKKGDTNNYIFDSEGNPHLGGNGRPIPADTFGEEIPEGLSSRAIALGDLQIDVNSPFEMFPDPLATELDECEYIIEEKVRSKEYVQTKFDFDAKEDTDAPIGVVESRMVGNSLGGSEAKGVTVKEMWCPTSSKYSKGKWVAWINEKVLVEKNTTGDDSAPFSDGPYVMFRGPEVPGRFWPTSITSQLRGPQTELNKIKSQISENASRIGNPALLRPRTSNIEYSGVPGEDLTFDDNSMNSVPTYLTPPEIPVYVREEIDRIEASITEISGVHEISKATVPSGVTAASAINLLQEADDTRLGPEIQDMELALGSAGTKMARLMARYQDDERFLKIAGEDGEWNIRSFRGAVFKNDITVNVQAGSAMPRSKAAKQAAMQEVFNLVLQYGVDVNQRDLRQFFKDYEVGGLEKLFMDIEGDELQVKRENNKMYNAEAVDINTFDDDDFHIIAHNDERKTRRFENASEQVKGLFELHVNAHQERRNAQINLELENSGQPNVPPGNVPGNAPPQ